MAVTLISIAAMLLFEYLGFFVGVNQYLYDLSFRIRGTQQHSDRIIIAAIDEQTLTQLGRWPIRRSHYVSFLDKVNEAAIIGFDIIMAEPSEDDTVLATEIRQGRVILPVYFDSNLNPVFPVQSFEPKAVGHIHVEPDIDGVIRKVFHTIHTKELAVPSFASVIYETVTGTKIERQPVPPDESPPPDQQQRLAQRDVMRINYSGPSGIIQTISFSDVLAGRYPAQFFKDKIVLVGLAAIGLEDRILTPFSQQRNRMPGVEVHANIINNLLSRSDIRETSLWIRWLTAAVLSLFIFYAFMKLNESRAALLWLGCLVAVFICSYLLFSNLNFWLSPALLNASASVMFGAAYVARLDEAARRLDREYVEVASQLRWEKAETIRSTHEQGLAGFLSAGGINEKIRILTEMIDQVLFEKKLVDAVLLSDIQGMMLFNPSGKLVVENERARAIFQALSIKIENLDHFYQDLFPYIVKDDTIKDPKSGNAGFGSNISSTLFFSAPEKKYLKMDTSLISFNEGQYLLCIFTDVTKIKELEIMKGRIVSTVSHELKQPLTVIQGLGELLHLNLTGKQRKYSEIINQEVQRMAHFISRFLDISRLESGREQMKKAPVNMVELLRQAEPLFDALASTKGIRINISVPDEISLVELDSEITKQCIVNLVENAIKYSPPDSTVTVALVENAGGLKIDVIDNGYGIEVGELERIFEKFFRGKAAYDNGSGGSGLGLTFVKEAVEAQGGSVSAKSTPGHGSTFSVVFPVS